MWFPTNNSKKFLNFALSLPTTGAEQDWEIEMSNPNRISDFIAFFSETPELSYDQKHALVALILASFEDSYWQDNLSGSLWARFEDLISSDIEEYKDVMAPWLSCHENGFGISGKLQALVERANTD